MATKAQRISGWVLTALVSLFMIGASGVPKFFDFPGKVEMMNRMGIPLDILPKIAVIEITVALFFLIPRTAFLGAILVTGYIGGAIMTHLRVGDSLFEILFPAIIGILAWTALGLRNPAIFQLALGKTGNLNETA